MSDDEEQKRPDARLKLTRTKKGVLIIVPVPELGLSLNYITSVEYLGYLMGGTLRGGLMSCKYLGTSDYEQFLTSEEKQPQVNIVSTNSDNPLDYNASKQRKQSSVQITDDW